MNPPMLRQLAGGGEGRSALVAEVQLQPLVAPSVVPEGTRVGEGGATGRAAVGLDAAVSAPMSGQHAGVCERLTALVAQKWTFACRTEEKRRKPNHWLN